MSLRRLHLWVQVFNYSRSAYQEGYFSSFVLHKLWSMFDYMNLNISSVIFILNPCGNNMWFLILWILFHLSKNFQLFILDMLLLFFFCSRKFSDNYAKPLPCLILLSSFIYECECYSYVKKCMTAQVHLNCRITYACHLCPCERTTGNALSLHLMNVHSLSWPTGHSRFLWVHILHFQFNVIVQKILAGKS